MNNTSCNLCGADKPVFMHEMPDGRRINRCADCGLVYVHPMPETAEIEMSHEHGCYELWGEKYESLLDKKMHEWRELFAELAQLTPPGRLLDVGCGRGYCMALARSLGWKPTGVDIALEDVEFARKHHGLDVCQGTLPDAEFLDNHFNAIVMWSLIEHLSNPREIIEEAFRTLANGGVISISTCNVDSRAARDAGPAWEYYAFEGHLTFFSPATLKRMMESVGFTVLDVGGGIEFASPAMNLFKQRVRYMLGRILPPFIMARVRRFATEAVSATQGSSARAGENFIIYARKK